MIKGCITNSQVGNREPNKNLEFVMYAILRHSSRPLREINLFCRHQKCFVEIIFHAKNDADAALTLAEDSWAEIIVETVVEQIPYAGPAYSAYDFAKENKKLWDALSFVNNKAEKYVKRVDDVAASFIDKYGKKISRANAELRGALKLTSDNMQAHHVIPCELFKENSEIGDFVKSAVAGGFDFNKLNEGCA